MTIEKFALFWFYAVAVTGAVLIYAVVAMYAIDRLVIMFKVKTALLQFVWDQARKKRARKVPGSEA